MELYPVSLLANSTQAKAIAKDIIAYNTNILREYHIITSEVNNYISVSAYKDACKHWILTKECILKISNIFLGLVSSSNDEITLILPSQINYSI